LYDRVGWGFMLFVIRIFINISIAHIHVLPIFRFKLKLIKKKVHTRPFNKHSTLSDSNMDRICHVLGMSWTEHTAYWSSRVL